MMLRLIDIVMIILFGFISISHIDKQVDVELPRVKYFPLEPPDYENWLVLGVHHDGFYTVDYGSKRIDDQEVLQGWLQEQSLQNRDLRVRIRADRDAPMGMIRQVVDICTEEEIPLSLEMILLRNHE